MNGSVARSGSSAPCVQLKISFSDIATLQCDNESPVGERLFGQDTVAKHAGHRRDVGLGRGVTNRDHQPLAYRDCVDALSQLLCETVAAPALAGVEVHDLVRVMAF